MAQNAAQSTDDEALKSLFDQGMKLFDITETSNEATNSDSLQLTVKAAISKFEKATNLVSLSGMFSRNESLEELPTETLQYLLLPALLGSLSLKLCGQSRKDVIHVAEVYFKDFLQRCNDYRVTDVEVPQPSEDQAIQRIQTEQAKISSMIQSRDTKIKRYQEMKELKEKLSTLKQAMEHPNVDDETKREYFTMLLRNYICQALDELASIEQEKPILEYMSKHAGEPKAKERPRAPLKPVIITRDAVQKAIYGLGYPALPTLTIEEFYDQRVREGTFPASASNIPHATIQTTENDPDEQKIIDKEILADQDDPELLARQRNFDEYKDEHRRGSGNRHNRS